MWKNFVRRVIFWANVLSNERSDTSRTTIKARKPFVVEWGEKTAHKFYLLTLRIIQRMLIISVFNEFIELGFGYFFLFL